MISLLQVVLILIGLINTDPSRVSELQQIQAAIVQDLGQTNSTVTVASPTTASNNTQTTNQSQTQTGQQTQSVVTKASSAPVTYNPTPGVINSNATTTITVTASQPGAFASNETFNLVAFIGSSNHQLGQLSPTISPDGSSVSFPILVPDGIVVITDPQTLATTTDYFNAIQIQTPQEAQTVSLQVINPGVGNN